MERVLAVLNRAETAHSALVTAGRLHRILGGCHLEILHPRPDIDPMFMPTEEVWTKEQSDAFNARRETLVQTLELAVADWRVQEPHAPDVALRVAVGKIDEILRSAAAGFDLVILGSAGAGRNFEAKLAIETVLMDAKISTLLVPEDIPTRLGHCVAVAWEPSRAAEDAIDAALPVLQSSDQVVVLIAKEGRLAPSQPERLMEDLQKRGIMRRVVQFDLNGRDIGSALLEEAHAVHADLLVMGAFTHHRFMEALFGGATRRVLRDVTMPVLMHH